MRNLTAEELEWIGGALDRERAVNIGRAAGFGLSKLAPKPLQAAATASFPIIGGKIGGGLYDNGFHGLKSGSLSGAPFGPLAPKFGSHTSGS